MEAYCKEIRRLEDKFHGLELIGDVDRCTVYVSLAPGMENPAGEEPPKEDARCTRAASDVNPDHAAGQRVAEPACAAEDAAPQTTDQPAAAAAATGIEGESAPASATASTPPRDGEAGRTAPPSSVAKGEDRTPTPPPAEERRVPTAPRAGASSSAGAPGLAQGPVMPSTTTGGGAVSEEARASSDDEVEEIEGRPRDGRQHCSR
ncbi:atherin-like [Sorghum bicolor]|uniref:atherin-like n=1 Tax=Sorghum bicolor TaxID=4558 RepID=UPI000B4254AF|nr:atherin-like [Sorghum bicolor]|eukprot:XP_021303782.1 atherin-like [Sorghum bicolor]